MKPGSSTADKCKGILRAILPLSIFCLTWIIHFVWLGFFPEQSAGQDKWVAVDSAAANLSWWQSYLETQSYFLSFSYALSVAFTTVAIRKYREQRFCGAKNLVIGGVSLSGFIAFAGCFLIGCCGSPMLAVYLGLFGASFLPFAKSIVAGVTALFVIGAWWWMNRKQSIKQSAISSSALEQSTQTPSEDCGCDDAGYN